MPESTFLDYVALITNYTYPLSFVFLFISSFFIFKAGYKSVSVILAITSATNLFVNIMATASRTNELVEVESTYGGTMLKAAYNFWETIQYPVHLLAISIVAILVLVLSIQLAKANAKQEKYI